MQKGTICLKMQDEEPNLCKSYKRAPIYSVYILCAKINFRFKLAVNHISVKSSQLHHASFLRIIYGVHLTRRRAPAYWKHGGFVLILISICQLKKWLQLTNEHEQPTFFPVIVISLS